MTRARALLFLMVWVWILPVRAQHDCRSTKQGHDTARRAQKSGDGALATWPWDLLHQRITLDLTLGSIIAGQCSITAVPRADGTATFPLHLLDLTVDSVTSGSGPLAFIQEDELLTITMAGLYNSTDTVDLTVHYRGDPATDPSGFGGFYTGSPYTYNLGVAFQSIPHSYGRSWFPCVDNFTERNSYEFLVRTSGGRSAWCNGELVQVTALGGDTLLHHWRIEETIPAYLASVAAANYTAVHDTFPSLSGDQIPVVLVARPQDTAAMRASFLHLPDAFAHFEERFGAYRWNKVGYVLTSQGAMEHSTSIHYPASIVDGTLEYEAIMAHELAHQWFGDLVTCERAEEMYINEGGAEFLSFLFQEAVYGRERYMQVIRDNHRSVVHRAHRADDGWWALSEIPQEWTYGEHAYNKGADVLHSLRGYMGDTLFFEGLTSFLDTYAFQPVNSTMLRDHLELVSDMPLTDFFDDWIFQPGWAAFEVDSANVDPMPGPDGSYATTVHIEQKQRGPSEPYTNVPMMLSCYSAAGERWVHPEPVLVGGVTCSVQTAPPFITDHVILNEEERISQAVTLDTDTLDGTGNTFYPHADLRITVNSINAPIPVRVEEYWVAADDVVDEPFAYQVSPDRWWRIHGAVPDDASLSGRILYDGRPEFGSSFDVGLMQDAGGVSFREDSLVLLYRPNASWPWSLHPDHAVNVVSNPTDKQGRVDFNGLVAGDYTLAWRKSATGMAHLEDQPRFTIHPNPAADLLRITCTGNIDITRLSFIDARGRTALRSEGPEVDRTIDVSALASGTYHVQAMDRNGRSTPVGTVTIAR